ncbi:MAG: type II toxin-antitoxin system VapC family toxin [Bacteroidota bacterium]
MASFLLDIHTLLWHLGSSKELSKVAYDAIINEDNSIYISIVSFWEIAIKVSLKKLETPEPPWEMVGRMSAIGINVLPIRPAYLKELGHLSLHHRDPFDRMIISTAISEQLVVITRDRNFSTYNLPVLW